MRRDARHTLGRWTASGLAVVGLLTGTAGAAWADGADEPVPVTFTGPDHYDLALDSQLPEEGSSFQIGIKAPGEAGNGTVYTGDYTVVIDASGLKGVADVRMADDYECDVEDLVATCELDELDSGTGNLLYGIGLAAADGSAAGDQGVIKVTGEGEGLSFAPKTIDVLVGAPDYRMLRLHEPDGFQAGDTFDARLAFRNVGGMAAQHVVLRAFGSRGLTFAQEFSNCDYGVAHPDSLLLQRHVAVCEFDGTFEVGQAYRLSTPMKVKTADFALRDNFGYYFTHESAASFLEDLEDVRHGDGTALKLEKADTGGTYVRNSGLPLATHNTYDLDLTGERVEGAKGETVTATVTLTDHGPAWIGRLRSGGEPIGFYVEAPEGATVTKAPDSCSPSGAGDAEEVASYLCFADTPFLEDSSVSFPFELHIDEVVEGAMGRAHLPDRQDPNEAVPANDDGWIVLNGTGDEETPGDGPADDGTGPDQGGDEGGSDDGAAGGSDDDGADGDGSDDGAAGGTDDNGPDDGADTAGDEDGALAVTGSDALTLGGLAALLLAGGAAVTVAMRRRRAAGAEDAAA